MMKSENRIVFLDYLRVIACFMVIVIHACEPFYLGGEEGTYIKNTGDAFWVTLVECLCRVCVPLFVMASSYLLFPVEKTMGEFLPRRFLRVSIPCAFWMFIYVCVYGGEWGKVAFNFPDAAGHLWFVPMLLGLYLLMPILSPWAEKAKEKEVRFLLFLWLLTTLFPFLRRLWSALYGAPSFGAVPYLYGECPWNMFGTFHYVSGFIGYVLLGFWFRKFAPQMTWVKTISIAAPLWIAGISIIGCGFFFRIPKTFPFSAPYAFAVDLEMSIEYCSTGVALATIGAFMVIRKFTADGAFYRYFISPFAKASYGTYLIHMFVLLTVLDKVKEFCSTPCTILVTAIITFIVSSLVSLILGRIPKIGRWIMG
jgi:surface polysaccharide O-acyltransferase-like enzyme